MASLQISFLPCNTDRWWIISCEPREASETEDRSVNSYMVSCLGNIGNCIHISIPQHFDGTDMLVKFRTHFSYIFDIVAADQQLRHWPKFCRYGPLARYVKLRVADAPGIPGTFSPSPRVSDPDMHHGTCVTHVPLCLPRSLTSGFVWSRWQGKHSRNSHRNFTYMIRGTCRDTIVNITKSLRFQWIYPKITAVLCPVFLIIVSYLEHSYVFLLQFTRLLHWNRANRLNRMITSLHKVQVHDYCI